MDIQARWWSIAPPCASSPASPDASCGTLSAGPCADLPGDARPAAAVCRLCFRGCRIESGKKGFCRVRSFDESGFHSPNLGKFCSRAIDPIEKKPIHHWKQGTQILSVASTGCTMHCPFCQNHAIAWPKEPVTLREVSPEELARLCLGLKITSVAYTYNEPTLQAEYIVAAGPILKEAGVDGVLVTNGMMSAEARDELIPWTSAANIDVKTFNPDTYARMGGSLETVKANVEAFIKGGTHVELTTLVVPGVSDDPEEFVRIVDWIASISPDIPFHISRYFPAYKYAEPATSVSLMYRFRDMARARLKYVHFGNI